MTLILVETIFFELTLGLKFFGCGNQLEEHTGDFGLGLWP